VLIHTTNGVYEVHETDRRYRLRNGLAGELPGAWCDFDRMAPVRTGSPLVFFVARSERGRVLHFNVVRTSPVTQVLAETG
jgi:hypothetical protein